MTMTDLDTAAVETIARAIQGALGETYSRPGWDYLAERSKDKYRIQARAALAALHTTHTVVRLPGQCIIPTGWGDDCLGAWPAGAAFNDPVSAWPRGQVATPDDKWIDPTSARALAVALLAAAAVAERQEDGGRTTRDALEGGKQ